MHNLAGNGASFRAWRKRLSGIGTFLISTGMILAVAVVAVRVKAAAGNASQSTSQKTLLSKLSWRNVGPFVGGRVVAVTGVPGEPNLFYMGTVGGGIWKSTNYGIRWTNISDGQITGTSASIGAIAVAPSNPNILYAGTGECDIRNTMIPGDGMFKSTDAGKTWHRAGLEATHTICAITIDPKNPDVVYAASMGHVFGPNPQRGVFKSTDGGKTWQKSLFVNNNTGVINLVMDPSDPNVLYAATWQAHRTAWGLFSGGPGSGLYKTTDGGANWQNITHSQGYPTGLLGRIGVTVSPANPQVVYSIVQAKDGGVFRSSDGGKNWTTVNADMTLRQRAFYYMGIFADPKDPNTVYIPQVQGLWISHDGGKTYRLSHLPHGDNHIVWVNPNNTNILLEGNDGGASVSTDGGKTWSTEHNQPTGQFYHINLDDQFPYHIYGAQQDEGSTEGPSASPGGSIPQADWNRVAYGESTFVVPQPGSPNITYGSGYFSILMRFDLNTGQYQEVSPWPLYREGAASNELKYRFAWTHPILFSPTNPKELLVGAQYVLKSDDYGRTWQKISPDLTRNLPSTTGPSGGPIDLDESGAEIYATISSLAVSPKNGNVIWAGSDDGLVHATTDGGTNWKEVRPPELPKMSYVTSIQPSHTDAGTAYLTADRYQWDDLRPYVYKTTDYGQHWTSMITGLPDNQYVFVIRQDPNDANLLFLGTSTTVYVSLNGGAQWQPLTLNLPIAQVRDIRINTRQGQVAVATHGRAFWVLDNLGLLEQVTKNPSVAPGGTFLFAPQQAWLTHAYGRPASSRQPPNSGKNPPFGATVFFHIPANYDGHTPVTLRFATSMGQTVRTFHLHMAAKKAQKPLQGVKFQPTAIAARAEKRLTGIRPGMNRFQWDLRYASATEVKGFEPPAAAGGLPDTVQGPVVTPGTYTVTLDYGGRKTQQSFTVALDPRLHATAEDLTARLDLGLKIRNMLDSVDTTVNRAIDARQKLEAAVAGGRLTHAQADAAIDALNHAIGDMVQLKIQSSEGSLLYETQLRSDLAYLAADIDLSYTKPTVAEGQVYQHLSGRAEEGKQKLAAAIAQANKLL